MHKRRGICGWVTVFKVTGAACEEGRSLSEVIEVFDNVNYRTRTLGVAFSGCTLPGADGPLFTVPEGKMGVGLGVHGEPGIYDADLGSANDVAQLLVDGLLKDKPDNAGDRVIALLNGLGSTTYEELFVTYGAVERMLTRARCHGRRLRGRRATTSMDMGGVSLSLTWTDDEIERLWNAPVDTSAIRRGTVDGGRAPRRRRALAPRHRADGDDAGGRRSRRLPPPRSSPASSRSSTRCEGGRTSSASSTPSPGTATTASAWSAAPRTAWPPHVQLAAQGGGAQTVLAGAGEGGPSRPAARRARSGAASWPRPAARSATTDAADVRAQTRAAAGRARALQRIGGAELGDKTMLDALVPAVRRSRPRSAGGSAADAWAKAAQAAEAAARRVGDRTDATQIGRARPLAERSVGHADAGRCRLARAISRSHRLTRLRSPSGGGRARSVRPRRSASPLVEGSVEPPARLFDAALLDLDGVLYVGPDAVPGAPEAVERPPGAGMRWRS